MKNEDQEMLNQIGESEQVLEDRRCGALEGQHAEEPVDREKGQNRDPGAKRRLDFVNIKLVDDRFEGEEPLQNHEHHHSVGLQGKNV